MAEEIKQIEINKLKPHTHNELIYGDEDVSDLIIQIEAFGKIIEPLKAKEDGTIISGHRRWKAAKELNYDTIPCEIVSFDSDEEELAALVLYNYGRKKTNEQKAREGMALFETLSVEAVQRRLANLNQNNPDVDNSSISDKDGVNFDTDSKSERGLTRDKVAKAVGISSGKTFDRMREVLTRVDELKKDGNTVDSELYIAVLNKTPSAARDLIDVPIETLTDKNRGDIRAGKVAPRKFLPSPKKEKSVIPPKSVYVINSIKNIEQSITDIGNSISAISTEKQKELFRTRVKNQIDRLQNLLSIIESESEKKEEPVPTPDKKKSKKKADGE